MTCAVVVLGKHHRWCETCQQAWLVPEGVDRQCPKMVDAEVMRTRAVERLRDLAAKDWWSKEALQALDYAIDTVENME